MIKRRGESGNVFFTLFGAVALVGVVGVATSTLMRGPVGTVVTLNQRAKVESQLQIARKLAALEAANLVASGGACAADTDTDYLEPLSPDVGTTGCSALLGAGTGCLPSTVGAAKFDPWGTMVGYCAWNHGVDTQNCNGAQGAGSGSLFAGEAVGDARPVLAVVSAGPDRTFQSTCAASPGYLTTGGDDIAFTWTYEEAAEGVGSGLWALKSNNPDQITTSKDLDVTTDATFRGANTTFQGASTAFQDDTAFNDQTNFSATADANFALGSSLNLGAGGFFNLPTQVEMTNAQCVAGGTANANRGVLRRNNSNGREALEICNSTGWIRAGSAVAGNVGEVQFNAGSDELGADSGFFWNNTTKRLSIGSGATPGYTLDVTGTSRVTGAALFGNTLTVADTFATTLGGATVIKGTLDAQGAISNTTGSNPVVISDDVTISGGISDPDSAVTITDSFTVTGVGSNADFDNNVNVDGTMTITNNTLTVVGDFATTLGGLLDVDKTAQASRFITDGANTAALPAFQIGTGGGTGIFSSGANYLNFSTGSSPRMVIEPSGEVGIGVAAPATALDLYGAVKIGMDSSSCAGALYGAVRFSSTGDTLQLCSSSNTWVTIGTSAGGGEGAGSWWQRVSGVDPRIYFNAANVGIGTADPQERLHVSGNTRMDGDVLAVGNYNGADNNIPASGAGTRMFFDSGKAAFRAGQVSGTQWNEPNVGDWSFSAGGDTTAAGNYGVAFGASTSAAGHISTALGYRTIANNSHTMAIGLGNSSTGPSTVSANDSFGIFMGNQSNVNFNSSNTMGLFGGKFVVDPSVPATDLAPTGTLTVDIKGKLGATHFCDNTDDTKCISALDFFNGNVGLFEKVGGVVRGKSPTVDYAADDFVWGSGTLADVAGTGDDNRMFFDKSKGAFRAGASTSTLWDDALVGTYSTALGVDTRASGVAAMALGRGAYAQGDYALALGNQAIASANQSMVIGLGVPAGAYPQTSGASSMGIFMGDQSAVNFAATNTMGLFGGKLLIDPAVPATNLSVSAGLTLDVQGKVGATEYCDANGTNCVNPGGGSGWVDRFTELADAPNSYTGHGKKFVNVNAAATALEFSTLYNDAGKVGVGIATPATALEVAGSIKVGSGPEACAPGTAGAIRYNALNLEICNGSTWKKAGSPGGNTTEIQFNDAGDFNGDSGLTYDKTLNALTIGTGGVGALYIDGNVRYRGWLADISDKRMKTNIEPLKVRGSILDKVSSIGTYSYLMRGDEARGTEFGVMAQELETVFPELVQTDSSELKLKSVNYVGLIAPMIESIKELKAENDNLKLQIASLDTDIKGLKAHTGYGIDKASFADRSVIFAALGALVLSSFFFMMGMFFRRR